MASHGALFEAREINAWRGDRHILRDVSFTVRAGEFLKITGPNGVGKTTLLRVICGLLPAETGEIHWNGKRVRGTAREEFHMELAYLGHLNSLKADLTARENLKYLSGLRQRLDSATIDGALDRVGILSRGDLPARSLSAGQKRRLALARQLLAGAAMWILDEPVTNLDTAGVALVEELIEQHVAAGGMAIAAAHQRLLDDSPVVRRLELQP
ncbi:MAG TPA: cytochrome c biogenesis heme-transporting ATPase CcmA [Steroidobacteraceae bacterium]|nr:cytochrome c biogenesis heme-transporting ATPase CcmA [Steroidobacteraceae bacterium]